MANRDDSYLGRSHALFGAATGPVVTSDAAFGAGWPTFTPGAARALVSLASSIDRRVTGEAQAQVCLRTTRRHAPTSEGESLMARAPP